MSSARWSGGHPVRRSCFAATKHGLCLQLLLKVHHYASRAFLQTQSYSGGATVPLSHSMAFVTILMPSALIAALFVTYGLIEHINYPVKKSLWINIKYQCLGTVHSCQSETKPRKGLVHSGRRSSPDGCERTPARTRSWQNLGELVPFLL